MMAMFLRNVELSPTYKTLQSRRPLLFILNTVRVPNITFCLFVHRKHSYKHLQSVLLRVGVTRDDMTGSSSDDWILLAFRLQPLNHNHNAIAIPHTLQSLFTLIFSLLICIHNLLLSLRAALH
jgi:hypothetical protein